MTRNTHQKAVVEQTVRSMRGHLSADEIYHQVQEKIPTIGRATVFRILNQMAQQGVVRRLPIPGRADCFDIRLEKHFHLRCQRCGGVSDLEVPSPDGILEQARRAASDDIQLLDYALYFYGICSACKTPSGK